MAIPCTRQVYYRNVGHKTGTGTKQINTNNLNTIHVALSGQGYHDQSHCYQPGLHVESDNL